MHPILFYQKLAVSNEYYFVSCITHEYYDHKSYAVNVQKQKTSINHPYPLPSSISFYYNHIAKYETMHWGYTLRVLVADKASKREKCASAKKAVEDASKRYWPALGGLYPPYLGSYGAVGSYSVPVPLGVPVGLPYGYGGYYGYWFGDLVSDRSKEWSQKNKIQKNNRQIRKRSANLKKNKEMSMLSKCQSLFQNHRS